MRYLITLLLLLLPSVCFGFGVATVGSLGSGVVASGEGEIPTPDYYWQLLDDAESVALLPENGGVYATAPGNTSTLQTGSGIDLPDTKKVYVSTAGVAADVLESGDFTIQGTFTSIAGETPETNSVYLFNSALKFDIRLHFGAVGNITLYSNGASCGNATTGYDFVDEVTHVVRIVYDATATTAALYIGTSESTLSLHYTWTSVVAPSAVGTTISMGTYWGGVVRDWKMWKSKVIP